VIEQNGRIHNQVAELLSAYIDGEVTGDERALVETHLATCVTCARDMATLRQTVTMLRQLPPVAAPRPFTLRESDVAPTRPARPAWWRLPWAQGLVAATAMLLCVAAVGGVLLLGRTGTPQPVALQAPAPTEATAEKMVVEKTAEVEAEKAVEGAKETPPSVEAPAPPFATEETVREAGAMAQEAPAEATQPAKAAQAENEAAADHGETTLSTTASRAAAAPAAVPPPTNSPAPEATPVVTPTVLLEVENLHLQIEPGIIRVSGRLPLPEGRKLVAELWRNGQSIEWATPESQQTTVEAEGQFSLELKARPGLPDFNLFGAEPADYEIRIHPVDPPAPVEARIPFDTYGPPPPSSTSSP
jgi:hypothetical protein